MRKGDSSLGFFVAERTAPPKGAVASTRSAVLTPFNGATKPLSPSAQGLDKKRHAYVAFEMFRFFVGDADER